MEGMYQRRDKLGKKVALLAEMGMFSLLLDSIALDQSGTLLAVAAGENGVSLWSMDSYSQQFQLEIAADLFDDYYSPTDHPYEVYQKYIKRVFRDLAFSDHNEFIAAALTNSEVYIWTREGFLLETIKRPAVGLAFVPHSELLALCLSDGSVELWNILPAQLVTTLIGLPDVNNPILAPDNMFKCQISCSSDGTQLATMSLFYDSAHWKAVSGVQIWNMKRDDGQFSPFLYKTLSDTSYVFQGGEYLAGSHEIFCFYTNESQSSGQLWGIDTDTGSLIILSAKFKHPFKGIYKISPDKTLVAIARVDGSVIIWDVQQQEEVLHFQAHERVRDEVDAISALFWLSDGNRLVTVGCQRKKTTACQMIKVWKLGL